MNYNTGDELVYKNYDVCRVEAIEKPDFIKHTDMKYYKLKIIFSSSNGTVYVPVDADEHLRPVISAQEAENYLKNYKIIPSDTFNAKQSTLIAEHYDKLYEENTTDSFLTLIKEILSREKETNRSPRQIEAKYLDLTEKPLSEEFALVLHKTPTEIKQFFRDNA